MTQPPDDRPPMPVEPGADVGPPPDDQATVAWTPRSPNDAPATEGLEPVANEPSRPAEPPLPASPIISATPATPAAPASGWVQPGPPSDAPLVAWESPPPPAEAPGQEGFVIAGVGARIVAYLIDSILVSIVPALLSLLITDQAVLLDAFDAAMSGSGVPTLPVTTDDILVTLIALAVGYIYFVGFWTGRSRATPGMRGLKLQVANVMSGHTLSLVAATKRWIALGAPLGLLSLVDPLRAVAGLLGIGVVVIVFLTTVTNERRQGLHDRWASSLVIRSTTSGDSATAVGCVVFALLAIAFAFIISVAALVALGPGLNQILSRIGESI